MVVQKAGVHTVSITKAESEVKKIDNKFLPTPDWNQNDKRSPDYVKNRTHWVEIAMVEVVPKTKFVTDEYRGSVSANVPSVTPEEGKKVIISLDGVDYNCEWVKRDDTYVVGDPENMADPPFALYTGEGNSEGTIYFASGSAGEEHTIGMSEEGEKYHALDRGFLPGSIDTLVGNAFIIQDGSPYLHLLGSGAKASVHQFVAAVEKTFGIPMIIDGDTGLLTSIIMYQPDYGDCARVGFFKYDEATGVATFEIRYTSEYQLPDS